MNVKNAIKSRLSPEPVSMEAFSPDQITALAEGKLVEVKIGNEFFELSCIKSSKSR